MDNKNRKYKKEEDLLLIDWRSDTQWILEAIRCGEEDFNNGEIPIMNTPTWLDIYLIQNCPIKFVINRMKGVYDSSYDELSKSEFPWKLSDEYKQNRRVIIKPTNECKFPFSKKMWNRTIGSKYSWWLQCEDINYSYNVETKIWSHRDMMYPSNTNTSHHKTTKSLIRFLRKQYLPKGLIFTLSGRYIGEKYIIKIK
jgi:hypothetical protein